MTRPTLTPLVAVAALLSACAPPPRTPIDTQARLSAALHARPIVLLGEVHDNGAQHALRAQALRHLLESGARPALLMEQFDRERQPDLDRALAGPGVRPDDVIAAATPADPALQGWSWPFYKPYIALAIEYRLPIVAANVSRTDVRRVLKDGLPSLGFDANVPADIEAVQARAIVDGHCGMIDTAQAGRMVGAQVARDRFMARAIEVNAARGAVLIAGNGHVRRDVGVPRWLSEATRARSVSIGLLEPGDPNASAFDVAFTTPAQSRADPCERMRGVPKR
ncbi:MAG: ChaN family lipoprotein [Pseudomonadota bacterium]